jgi:glutathione peroxidase
MERRNFLQMTAALPLSGLTLAATPAPGRAAEAFSFESIDGGSYDLADWRGHPVLVVNTASQCGFTPQYDALQALQDRFGPDRLAVLAVPSDDFAQELDSNAAVAEFCDLNFNLTLPMTTITSVRGGDAHPFYQWVRRTAGFVPQWNFNKILLNADGEVVATFGSIADPMGGRILGRIEALLSA